MYIDFFIDVNHRNMTTTRGSKSGKFSLSELQELSDGLTAMNNTLNPPRVYLTDDKKARSLGKQNTLANNSSSSLRKDVDMSKVRLNYSEYFTKK